MSAAALDVLILRDPRESTRKCSLTPLRGHPGLRFARYDPERRVDAGRRLLLDPRGEPITERDRGLPVLLVDCAWRRVDQLLATVDGELLPRRLPELRTAYPRKSRLFEDPERGLASVEALYALGVLLDLPVEGLLEGYRWKDEFLALNPGLASQRLHAPARNSADSSLGRTA